MGEGGCPPRVEVIIVRTSAQAESCPHSSGIYEKRSRKSRKYFKKLIYYIVIIVFNLTLYRSNHVHSPESEPNCRPCYAFHRSCEDKNRERIHPWLALPETSQSGEQQEKDSETVVIEVTWGSTGLYERKRVCLTAARATTRSL